MGGKCGYLCTAAGSYCFYFFMLFCTWHFFGCVVHLGIAINLAVFVLIEGIASGADSSWIYEEPYNINSLTTEVIHMKKKMKEGGILRGLVLRYVVLIQIKNTYFCRKPRP